MISNQIKDRATREAVKKLEDKVRVINNIKPLSQSSTLADVINAINKITDSVKRDI